MFVIYFYEMHIKIEAIIREQKFYLCPGTVRQESCLGSKSQYFPRIHVYTLIMLLSRIIKSKQLTAWAESFACRTLRELVELVMKSHILFPKAFPSVASTNSGRKQRSNGEPAEELEYFNIMLPFASNLFCLFNYTNKIISS